MFKGECVYFGNPRWKRKDRSEDWIFPDVGSGEGPVSLASQIKYRINHCDEKKLEIELRNLEIKMMCAKGS